MKKFKNIKRAKFFCEFCGNEVKQNDKFCNYCGKFFASVRCPNCGKTGRTEEFTNGCPACGYAVSQGQGKSHTPASRARKNYDGSLPFWIYIIVFIVLAILVVGLYSCLT